MNNANLLTLLGIILTMMGLLLSPMYAFAWWVWNKITNIKDQQQNIQENQESMHEHLVEVTHNPLGDCRLCERNKYES